MELQINQWGNSLALRIPASVAKQMRLKKGSKISLVVNNDGKAALEALPEVTPIKTFAQIFAELALINQGLPVGEPVVAQMRRDARY